MPSTDNLRLAECPDCDGSGEEIIVVMGEWPDNGTPHEERTGNDCPNCGGSGRVLTVRRSYRG